jgi:hypothetical protein
MRFSCLKAVAFTPSSMCRSSNHVCDLIRRYQPCFPSLTLFLRFLCRVLQRRIRQKDFHTVPQVLVQWSGQPEASATWEDLEAL